MRNCLLSGIALAAVMTSSAFAADLPSRKFAPVAPLPTFTWTGFYAGVNVGAAFNHGSMTVSPSNDFRFVGINNFGSWRKTEDETSFVGGAQVGYNYQMGNIVLGAEADFSFADLKNEQSGYGSRPGGGPFLFEHSFRTRTKVDWFGTLRARVGFTPLERLMVYGTGGLAYGQVKTTASELEYVTAGGLPAWDDSWAGSKNDTRFGWTLGAGAEYAITNNLSLKAEYLYVDLGKQRVGTIYNNIDPALMGTTGATVESATKFSVVRAGLNYRF